LIWELELKARSTTSLNSRRRMLYSQKESRKVVGIEEVKQKSQVWGHEK